MEEESYSEENASIQREIPYTSGLRSVIRKIEGQIPTTASNILDTATHFFREWTERGRSESYEYFLRCYRVWMTQPLPDGVEQAPSDFSVWQGYMFNESWRAFARDVLAIITIPCAEVQNERCFSLKRYIIGKHSTRTGSDLLTARARLPME